MEMKLGLALRQSRPCRAISQATLVALSTNNYGHLSCTLNGQISSTERLGSEPLFETKVCITVLSMPFVPSIML
jgi:hypothetical protein